MKKILSIFLILNLMLLTIPLNNYVYAAESQFQPIVVTGFNEDLIADNTNGNSAETSTTVSFDVYGAGANNVMYSVDFRGPKNTASAPPYGLPSDRVINSSQNSGVSYNLAAYNTNNALFLIDKDQIGTLTLESSGAYEKIIVLASSASGASDFNVTLNFSDGTHVDTSFTAPDWFNGNGYAIKGIGRVARTGNFDLDGTFTGDSDNPRLYDCFIDNSAQKTKLLTSISVKKTSTDGRTAILAVAGQKSAGAPSTPVSKSALDIKGSSFDANWEAVAGATSYYLDVATDSSFTHLVAGYNNLDTGDITSYSVTGLDNNSTYYYRVRAVNANGVSFSSSNISVTTLSSNATIVSVLSQTITAGSEAGTSGDPKTASISVANNVSTVAVADIVKHDAAATVTFYGTDSSFSTAENGSVNLTAGTGTAVYIKVVAEDGTAAHYKVTINRDAPLNNDAGLSSVLSQTITAGSEAGTSGDPKTASISVANNVSTVALADIVKHDTGATVTFYGTDSSFSTAENGSVNLTAGTGTAVYIKVVAEDGTAVYYKVTIIREASLSNDAGLSSVLSQTITAGSEEGTSGDPKTASISVANNVSTVAVADIVKHDTGATVTFYGTDSSFSTAENGSVNLTAGTGTAVYIKVVAEDGTAVYYKVTITRASASSIGSSSGGGSSNGGSSTPTTPSNQDTAVVIVNGKAENAGTETKITEAGKTIVTVEVKNTVIDSKIEEAIKNNPAGTDNLVQIPVADKTSDVVKVDLTGDIVKKLEDNAFDISIKRDTVEYLIPAEELTITNVAKELGVSEQALKDIKIEVQITKLDALITAKYNEVAKANGAGLLFPPVAFEIVAKTTKADGTTADVEISKFSNYVERVLEIPAGVDPSKITTGIVFNPDGTYSHVPTEVFQKDGKWYAKLNSLTNSNYSVIWNPVTVKSVEKHWSKDAVNDMASRLVVFNAETFSPDKAITRADFAEYIVRALGLYREGSKHENKFKDVSATGDRTLAILIASEYGIVTGYPDGTFKPDALITREEAMTMYQRAMKITKLVGTDNNRYQSYTDYKQVGSWATPYVQAVLSAHVFNGTAVTTISPKSNLTYAEAAQAIKNLLVESKLINK